MRVKATTEGLRQTTDALAVQISNALEKKVTPFVKKIVRERIENNKESDGEPRPRSSFVSQKNIKSSKSSKVTPTAGPGEKSPDTIKAYKRKGKGWDTEHYLVRTGRSTTFKHKVTGKNTSPTFVFEPTTEKRKRILGYHIPMSKWRGPIQLFDLNDEECRKIIKKVSDYLTQHGFQKI